jgi:hypothetical protein
VTALAVSSTTATIAGTLLCVLLLLFVIRQVVLTIMQVRDALKTGDRSILQSDLQPIIAALVRVLDRIGAR